LTNRHTHTCIPAVSLISLGDQANTYVSAEENTKLLLWLKTKGFTPRGAQSWQFVFENAIRRTRRGKGIAREML